LADQQGLGHSFHWGWCYSGPLLFCAAAWKDTRLVDTAPDKVAEWQVGGWRNWASVKQGQKSEANVGQPVSSPARTDFKGD